MRTMSLSETKKLDHFCFKYFLLYLTKRADLTLKSVFRHVKRLRHNIENFGDFENKIFGYFQFFCQAILQRRGRFFIRRIPNYSGNYPTLLTSVIILLVWTALLFRWPCSWCSASKVLKREKRHCCSTSWKSPRGRSTKPSSKSSSTKRGRKWSTPWATKPPSASSPPIIVTSAKKSRWTPRRTVTSRLRRDVPFASGRLIRRSAITRTDPSRFPELSESKRSHFRRTKKLSCAND